MSAMLGILLQPAIQINARSAEMSTSDFCDFMSNSSGMFPIVGSPLWGHIADTLPVYAEQSACR